MPPPRETTPIVLPFICLGLSMGLAALEMTQNGDRCAMVAMARTGTLEVAIALTTSMPPVRPISALPAATSCTACAEPWPPMMSTSTPALAK